MVGNMLSFNETINTVRLFLSEEQRADLESILYDGADVGPNPWSADVVVDDIYYGVTVVDGKAYYTVCRNSPPSPMYGEAVVDL